MYENNDSTIHRALKSDQEPTTADVVRKQTLKLRFFVDCKPKFDEMIENFLELSGYAENSDSSKLLEGDDLSNFKVFLQFKFHFSS